jgi:hypothetical protein
MSSVSEGGSFILNHQDILFSCYNYLDEELNELNELEAIIKNTKSSFRLNNFGGEQKWEYDFSSSMINYSKEQAKRTDSLEIKNCMMSDCEEGEGYKSGGSYLSDNQYGLFKNDKESGNSQHPYMKGINKIQIQQIKPIEVKKAPVINKQYNNPLTTSVTIDLMTKQINRKKADNSNNTGNTSNLYANLAKMKIK